jgi:hypothetical protein
MLEFLQTYGVLLYGLTILFGGRYALIFQPFKRTVHNVLLFATVTGLIYIGLEVLVGTFQKIDAVKYFFTFTVVTSFYENIAKFIFEYFDKLMQKDVDSATVPPVPPSIPTPTQTPTL